jgi:hypothetical protein
LVLVLSGYGAGCPHLAQAAALLQLLLPQAEQACSDHSCAQVPPLPTFTSATIRPSSHAASAMGRIGGMISVASGHLQAMHKQQGHKHWPGFTHFVAEHGTNSLMDLACQYITTHLPLAQRPQHVHWVKRDSKWRVVLQTSSSSRAFGGYDTVEMAGFVAWLAECDYINVEACQ